MPYFFQKQTINRSRLLWSIASANTAPLDRKRVYVLLMFSFRKSVKILLTKSSPPCVSVKFVVLSADLWMFSIESFISWDLSFFNDTFHLNLIVYRILPRYTYVHFYILVRSISGLTVSYANCQLCTVHQFWWFCNFFWEQFFKSLPWEFISFPLDLYTFPRFTFNTVHINLFSSAKVHIFFLSNFCPFIVFFLSQTF